MKPVTILLLLVAVQGCRQSLSREETEKKLDNAMHNFLISRPYYDSTKVRYDVLSVNYFEDKFAYDCEFKVRLRVNGHDTTGIMTAVISKDFGQVKRKL